MKIKYQLEIINLRDSLKSFTIWGKILGKAVFEYV